MKESPSECLSPVLLVKCTCCAYIEDLGIVVGSQSHLHGALLHLSGQVWTGQPHSAKGGRRLFFSPQEGEGSDKEKPGGPRVKRVD